MILHLLSFPLAVLAVPLARRSDGYIQAPLVYWEMSFLLLEISVGTPGQTVLSVLDTGLADFFVSLPNVTNVMCDPSYCGAYSPNLSATWHDTHKVYDMQYVSGNVSGYMGTEYVSIAGATIKDQEFAVIYDNPAEVNSIFGAAPRGSENIYIPSYDNSMITMVNQGIISRNLLGLYAGTHSSTKGSVVFGGLDLAKFKGGFTKLSCYPEYSWATRTVGYWVEVGQISVANKTLLKKPIRGLFDTGTSILTLSPDLYGWFFKSYFNVTSPGAPVPCDNTDTLRIEFSDGYTLEYPMADNLFDNGDGTCTVGIASSGSDETMVVGIPALQNVYSVYDPEEIAVYVADVVQTDKEDPVSVPKGYDLTRVKGKGGGGGGSGNSGSGNSGSSSSSSSTSSSGVPSISSTASITSSAISHSGTSSTTSYTSYDSEASSTSVSGPVSSPVSSPVSGSGPVSSSSSTNPPISTSFYTTFEEAPTGAFQGGYCVGGL